MSFIAGISMALHFKTLLTRTLTAGVFVGIMISAVLFSKETFQLLILLIALLGAEELFRIQKAKNINKIRLLTFPLLFSFIIYSVIETNQYSNSFLQNVVFIFFIVSMVIAFAFNFSKQNSNPDSRIPLFTLSYIGLPLFAFNKLAFLPISGTNNEYHHSIILGVFYLIWINDTCAYLAGSLFGKHKLAPEISPGKTIEGTIGGAVFAAGISYVVYQIFPEIDLKHWIIISLIISIFGTIGDLFESFLKRKAGIKDSGNILPGHGGILDRFDSLLFVAPFVYLYMVLVLN